MVTHTLCESCAKFLDIPMTIVAVSDHKYLPFLKVLITSAARNYPQANFLAHLVNVQEKDQNSLLALHPLLEITNESFSEDDPKKLSAYCANVRAEIIFKTLKRGDSCVVYFDADSIIRKSLDSLERLLMENDLLVLTQSTVKKVSGEATRFAAGVLAFKNTPKTIEFVSHWKTTMEPHLEEWSSDQIFFSRTYDEFVKQLKIGALPFSFIDWIYYPSSEVWVGKGVKKTKDPLYRLETRRYEQTSISFLKEISLNIQQFFWYIWKSLNRMRGKIYSKIIDSRNYFALKKR